MRIALSLCCPLVLGAVPGCTTGTSPADDGGASPDGSHGGDLDAASGSDGHGNDHDGGGGGDDDDDDNGVDAGPTGCLEAQTDHRAPSTLPPNGLDPQSVPQFVMFGFDDDAYAEGMHWVVDELFAGRHNADGSPALATFFIIGGAASDDGIFNDFGGQSEQDLVDSWRNALEHGHEIGNHTWDHVASMDGRTKSLDSWRDEVNRSHDKLKESLDLADCDLAGFRFPRLEFNENGYQAVDEAGYAYETSMEFGYDYWYPPPGEVDLPEGVGIGGGTATSSKHFWWPFTLDEELPSNYGLYKYDVGTHPGLWVFPAHVFVKIDGDMASNVTGFDYNLWLKAANDSSFDFCSVLKQTFDQRYNNNRSPMNVGVHSDIYSQYNEEASSSFHNTYQERREALQCFLDYVLSKPDARVVTYKDVIRWLRDPQPL
jgi:peptidoglycan/xylan/chitin deacetylase (PgdA/CDA1 family)